MKRLRLLSLTASAALVVACGGGAPEPAPTVSVPEPEAIAALPESAVAQMKALLEEKNARTPAQKKISSALLYAKSGRFAAINKRFSKAGGGSPPTGKEEITSLLEVDDQGRVLSDIKGDVDAGLERQVETAGGSVVYSSIQHRAVRAWLPLGSLEALASQNIVRSIRPAMMAQTNRADPPKGAAKLVGLTRAQRVDFAQNMLEQLQASPVRASEGAATFVGAQQSAGDSAHGAGNARKFYNTFGAGVRVGVLSDSDDFKEQSIASGDLLPGTVTVPGQSGRPGSGEGTAMMEIIQDIAPQAQIFFATAFTSPESFADNIRRLRFEFDCDVIVDDVIYFFESPYQDDIIAAAVTDVTADGALYFSSAGNSGNMNDGFSGTWEGDFKSAGALATLPAGYQVNDWDHAGTRVVSNRVEFGGGPLVLHWSDPGSLDNQIASTDYDLFVLSDDLRSIAVASTDIQDGVGGDDLPFEFLGFNIPAGFRVVVARMPGEPVRALHTILFGGELSLDTEGATYGHAAEEHAIGTAAIDAAEAVGGVFIAGPTSQVELFSSDGPRRVFYDRNGVRLRGGVTFASGGGVTRLKPDATAADGVMTNTPGFQPFFGTSAAAPHGAGIAALVVSAVPGNLTNTNRSAIINSALDIEAPGGHDRDSGAGIIMAQKALQLAGAKPAVFLERGTVTSAGGGGGPIVPGGTGTLFVQVLNNGGATATAVTGTLTSSTPGVTITTDTSAYSNIAAGGSATNAIPFAFSVDASVPCGTLLQFSLSVAFSGRGTSPTVFAATAQTGQAGAPITTSFTGPAIAIPDSNAAGVNVPLAVAGVGRLANLVFSIDGTSCSSAIGSTTVGLNHTWVGDLILRLTAPGGASVVLMNRPGGTGNSGNNFCQTVLDDAAVNPIQNILIAGAPWTGSFRPANPLSSLIGQTADGVWTLNVSDLALIDTGSVRAFSLRTSGFSCPAP